MPGLVLVERDGPVGVVLLDRPKQLNALSDELMDDVVRALQELDADDAVRCIVLGGSERAFAAGADVRELASASAIELYNARRVERWDAIRGLRTPLVAAVSGFCLGGGCELAMSCDLIVASETARFGQPETSLGIIPGAGGTQRLTRAVGKALAMDMILSGRTLSAREALAAGLVARVVAREAWLDEAKRVAREIAVKGPVGDAAREGGGRPRPRDHARDRPRVRAAGSLPRLRVRGRARGPAGVPRETQTRVQGTVRQMDVDELLAQARDAITVSRVFGEPIEEDGVTIVPVAAVRGGGGGGGDAEHNGGGGFGIAARPVGVYVIHGGEVTWRPAVDPMRLALGGQIVGALAIAAMWSLGRAWLRTRPRARPGRAGARALGRLARRPG